MAKDISKLQRDPLFLALTRPPMMMGVPYTWFMLNILIWTIVYINTNNFGLLFPGAGFFHAIGFFAASYEPRFMEIVKIWAQTVPTCVNRFYHGNCCSYDLY